MTRNILNTLLKLKHEGKKLAIQDTLLTRKTAINPSKIEYVELNLNPILGCQHACTYCYARKIDVRYGRVKNNADWHRPKLFSNILELLRNELESGIIPKDKEIFLSTMTDIYQPYAIKYNLPRKIITLLQEFDCQYRLLTKSPEVVNDIDILAYEKGMIGLSITTNIKNEIMRKKWEPRTFPTQKRLASLKILSENPEIPLWVSAEPFLPTTNFEEYFKEIFEATGDGLKEMIVGKMNYVQGVDIAFDWEIIVKIIENFANVFPKTRFHYKKEFMNYLNRNRLSPVELNLIELEIFNERQKPLWTK